jgi:arylsulfatase A-like enzyme
MSDRLQPNVVFMLGDNIGWGALSCYGGTFKTPRLDRLAGEGIRLENYNTEAQCTPTRSAILSGRIPVRSGTLRVPMPGEGGEYGLCPWEYTLAELFGDLGYRTACFGKWHVGSAPDRLPNAQGFDEWWGIPNSSDEASYTQHPLYPKDFPIPEILQGAKGEACTSVEKFDLTTRPFMDEKITERSTDFIARNAAAGTPFFLYASFTTIHPPLTVHPDFKGSSGSSGVIPDSIVELDHRAGRILDALDAAGVADNTIVVWSSDNAAGELIGQACGSGGPWRGSFGQTWEGSVRAPAMVRWPGRIPTGRVSKEIVAATDWLPTLAAMVDASERVPTDRPIDGIDVSAHLLGQSEESGRDHFILYGTDGGLLTVKWKTMKVHFRTVLEAGGALFGPYLTPQLPALYDLLADPQEKNNIIETSLSDAWAIGAALRQVVAVEESAKRFPHIKTGEEFHGYKEQH